MTNHTSVKKAYLVLCFLLSYNQLLAQDLYLQGKIKGCDNEWVYLSDYDTNQKLDSARCKNEHVVFKRHLEEHFMAKISREADKSSASFFVENTKMTFEGPLKALWESKAIGSAINDLNTYYNGVVFQPFRLQFLQSNIERNRLKLPEDSLKIKAINEKLDSLQAVSKRMTINQIKKHSDSFYGLYVLHKNYRTVSVEESKVLLLNLSDELKNTPTGKKLTELIYKRGTLKAGDTLPAFILNDLKSREVSSTTQRGKYIFYNFWASWCGPCRKEHPKLIELYKHRNAQKIEFISISTDEDLTQWKKAVQKDQLPWPQLIDKVGKTGLTVGQNLGIQGVPSNFLIDDKGVIVARDMSLQDFAKFLEGMER